MLTGDCFVRSMTNVITTNTSDLEKPVIPTNNIPLLKTENVSTNTIKVEVEKQTVETLWKQLLISADCQNVFFFWQLIVYSSSCKFLETQN